MSGKTWFFIAVCLVAFVPLVDPGRPIDHKVTIAAMLAVYALFHFTSGRPRRYPTLPPGPELLRLHTELLTLVLGDERLVHRLVMLERRRGGLSEEAAYGAAIAKLIRDRSA